MVFYICLFQDVVWFPFCIVVANVRPWTLWRVSACVFESNVDRKYIKFRVGTIGERIRKTTGISEGNRFKFAARRE